MTDSTTFHSKIFKEDLALATGGTGAAETGTRLTSAGGVLTLTKIDASHINYRNFTASLENSASSAYLCITEAEINAAITAIGSDAGSIRLINAITLTDDLTIASNIALIHEKGAILTIPTTKTLAINGTLDAGPYQIFSCAGTGAVSLALGSTPYVLPEWFGAVGDGTTDDTAALDDAVAACPVNGTLWLTKNYVTTGTLVQKTISIVTIAPFAYTAFAGTLKAAGAQAYVLKFLGVYAADASTHLHPKLTGININGDDQTISDAGLVMEYCHLASLEGISIQNCAGTGFRGRCLWEFRMRDYFILNCGVLDTGSAVLFDGVTPLDYAKTCNNVALSGGIWSSNKGYWLNISSLAGMSGFWFKENKLELDDITILNTVDMDVIHLGSAADTWIENNTFRTFGTSYGRYTNLIWIGGGNDDGNNGAPGGPVIIIQGNHHYAQNGSGAVNGLSLAAHAPTCIEDDNHLLSNSAGAEGCLNVNVSEYPQLINRTWRNFSTSLFPLNPLPDRELPGFFSIHKVSRGTYNRPFITDANCMNNSSTVLSLDSDDDGVPPAIFDDFDLSRYVGHSASHLIVRMRAKLSAAGTVTLAVNLSGGWTPVQVSGFNAEDWAWVEFLIPMNTITTANHLLDGYLISIDSGTPDTLIDGLEFATSDDVETLSASGAAKTSGYTKINSAGGAVAATLADGTWVGQRKVVTMTNATASSTLEVAHHATSDPETFTFAALGDTLTLEWNGTDWTTITNYGAAV